MKTTIASALLLAAPAMADFRIFIGGENSWSEGGGLQVTRLAMFNSPPSCSDYENVQGYVQAIGNDATRGGFACDGCNLKDNPKDWDITRLELPHSHEYSQEVDSHLTIYKGDEGYGLYSAQMGNWGSCERQTDDPQYLDCGTTGLYDIFHCTTELTSEK